VRVPVIAGNWKMHKTAEEAAAYMRAFLPLVADVSGRAIVVAPPFTALAAVAGAARGTNVAVACQNLHHASEGAFTGEVSAAMVRGAGATYAIVGHSERRQHFGETDESARLKVRAALAAGLVPILCVGETLPEREQGLTFCVVERQARAGLFGLEAGQIAGVVIAYEPVWAIGTGRTATPAQAQEVHAFLRGVLEGTAGPAAARAVRILYGGSVKPDNIDALMAEPDVDGVLVGGASLSPEAFARIVGYRK